MSLRLSVVVVLLIGGLAGCAAVQRDSKAVLHAARLETQLRRANARIETLREQNMVLKKRAELTAKTSQARTRDGMSPSPHETLKAFSNSVPPKAEETDSVLARAIRELIDRGEGPEAYRTFHLLQKSYPNSEHTHATAKLLETSAKRTQ